MKKLTTFKVTLAAMLLFFIGEVSAQMNNYWSDTLNTVLAQCAMDENMNGFAGAVVFSDGSVWKSATGYHGNDLLSPEYLYDIGSNTKTMVSTVILLLEEEGALSIDDKLYDYIDTVPHVSESITLKQLLNHRSGIASFTNNPNFGTAINNDETKFWHPDSILANFQEAPKYAPNANWWYSNSGYILLGKVIEAVENKPLNVVLRERIFDPMGLEEMYLDQYDTYTTEKTGSWLSPNFYYDADFVSFMSSAWAAGAVIATPEALAKYTSQLYGGGFLSEASMEKMFEGTLLTNGETAGLGAFTASYMGKTYRVHGGATLQNSEIGYSVESGFSLALMGVNQGYYDETYRARQKFFELLEYIEEVHESVVGIEDQQAASVQINAFPNPSNGQITLQVSSPAANKQLHIEVKDLSGRLVNQQQMNNGSLVLQQQAIGSGIYFVSLFDGNNNYLGHQKIVFN